MILVDTGAWFAAFLHEHSRDEGLGITTAFSFDQHFRQFGTVTVVP
jgi:predicted nucleic acid-binding protein